VLAASAGGATARQSSGSGTFVFGVAFDPITLDPAIADDLESLRPAAQIYESLVGLSRGGTRIVPGLATRWKAKDNGLSWIFTLRSGVRFHDGTPFDATAVCFNFERWYGFRGSFQRDGAFAWQNVFGGFRNPEPGFPGPDKSLYRGCRVSNPLSVRLLLSRRSSAFLAGIALPTFGIASPTALKRYDADEGSFDSGVFHPVGTYSTQHPTGTGPFMFKSWEPGKRLELVRNPRYWGKPAKVGRILFPTISDSSALLRALRRGQIDGYDDYAPADLRTIKKDRGLKLLNRPSMALGYVGMNLSIPPMDKLLVRQAVAYGLDRRSVVRSFFTSFGQAEVADQFLPPALAGYARDVRRYPYNPARAKALLRKAGLQPPVKIDFWFPTDVWRPYLPFPKAMFDRFASGLAKAGFEVVAHGAPWVPDYIGAVNAGKAQLYLVGWLGDYPDPADFLGLFFQRFRPQFGFRNPKLFELLARAEAETDPVRRARLYQQASRFVMELLPVVPYVYVKHAIALRRNVTGYVTEPMGPITERYTSVSVTPTRP
jgi:peptide/nickel transport system substrate-binding protein